MAQHEMTRHETRECAFYILFEMQFQNDTAEELFQVAEEADLLPICLLYTSPSPRDS